MWGIKFKNDLFLFYFSLHYLKKIIACLKRIVIFLWNILVTCIRTTSNSEGINDRANMSCYIIHIFQVINLIDICSSPPRSRRKSGYHGVFCSDKCRYPWFGSSCMNTCDCDVHLCDHVKGCPSFGKDIAKLWHTLTDCIWTWNMYM